MGAMPLDPSHAGAPEPEELLLGVSPAGRAASALLVALARAARSFLLYDADNDAIRHFLTAVREAADRCFTAADHLPLAVRPYEILLGSEVVYVERDRERSLAFRLYRDGVRRLVIRSGVTWGELLKLLEVLSVRYTGVRLAEDDMVVLLWKAGFEHVEVEAIEGVIEDVGEGESWAPSVGHTVSPPDDFDLPLPPLPADGPEPVWQPLDAGVLDALAREDASVALPALTVELATEVLAAASATPRLPLAEARHLFAELRDFLLAEGTLDEFVSLNRVLTAAHLPDPEDVALRDELAGTMLDARGMARLLRLLAQDPEERLGRVARVLDGVPGDHLPGLLQGLRDAPDESVRRAVRRLVERMLPEARPQLIALLGSADDLVAAQVVRLLGYGDPERVPEAVAAIERRADFDVQVEAIYALERSPRGPFVERALTTYGIGSGHPEVRARALQALRRLAPSTAAAAVLHRLAAGDIADRAEAALAGEVFAVSDPAAALQAFRSWVAKPRLFQYVSPHAPILRWAAVAGLAWLDTPEAETLIRDLERRAEDRELVEHCVRAMVTRRRRARGEVKP